MLPPVLISLALVLAACAPAQLPNATEVMTATAVATPTEQTAPNPQAGLAQANDISLAYESFGSPEDETILLIGGAGQQPVGWPMELVTALVERGYRVIRFDNRDVGLSTKLTEAGLPDAKAVGKALQAGQPAPIPYTLRDMAQDAADLLDALNIEQAHVVGISMGGAIAQWVAIDHPDRVLSLTSIAADSGNPELPVLAKPEAFANVPPQPTTADREAFITWQVKTSQALAGSTYPTDEATLREWAQRDFDRGFDPAGLVRQQTASLVGHFDPTRLHSLEQIKAPTVIVQGTEDPIVPLASAEDLAARIPDAELRVIEGLGHFIPLQLVPEIVEAITTVTSRATQPPTSENDLANTRWQLVSFGAADDAAPVLPDSTITLEFGADAKAGGESGCNSYGGAYSVHGDRLGFDEIVSTLKACADEAISEQEAQYLEALRAAGRYTLSRDILTIWYDGKGGVLNFERAAESTSETPMPTQTPERVELTPGTNSAQRSGQLPDGPAVKQYVLSANAGQTMTVAVTSDAAPLSLTITTPGGVQRIPEMQKVEGGYHIGHEFSLAETGIYLVTVTKAEGTPPTEYAAEFTIR